MKTLALTETVALPAPSDKLRLLHYSPALAMGGTNRMAADVAATMQMSGLTENVVLAPSGAAGNILTVNGIICRRAMRLSFLPRYLTEAKRFARILRSVQPQVVLLYSLAAVRVAWLACRRLSADQRPKMIAILPGQTKGFLATSVLNRCDAVVVFSKHQRKLLTKQLPGLAVPQERIWVIPYGVDEVLCHPNFKLSDAWKQDWERRHPQFHRSLSLCLPGSICPVRGLEKLPELLTVLTDQNIRAHAYIAGDTRRADKLYLAKLKKLFRNRRAAPNITWLNPRQGMREIMRVCDITLSLSNCPATYDRTILEALSLGCPVAGFDHGAVGELLDTFLPEGRVPAGDIAALTDTLVQWRTYRPDLPDTVPYPYRLTDTAESLLKLCRSLRETKA